MNCPEITRTLMLSPAQEPDFFRMLMRKTEQYPVDKIGSAEFQRECGEYPPEYRDGFLELERLGWEIVCRTFFVDRQLMFPGKYDLAALKENFAFALFAEGRRTLENGKGIWTIRTDRKTPGRAAIFSDKGIAVTLADKALALLKKIAPPADDFRWQLWKNAAVITRAVRELINCLISYYDDTEWEKEDCPHLKAQVAHSLKNLKPLKESDCSETVIKTVLEPLTQTCEALLTEFSAEFGARKKFLTGCEDGIVIGGLSDEWRIVRTPHAALAELYDGFPAYRLGAGGFIGMRLKRGDELLICGVPAETGKFVLICDGKRIAAELDENGCFVMPLAPGEAEVAVRLENEGAAAPLFRAAVTRNKGWENKKVPPLFVSRDTVMPKELVPEPVYDEKPELLDLYYFAWQSAWTHIFSCRKAPVSPYMNEGIRCHKIWIWDTCFMVHFCRYAANVFPGIQSLDNFYRVMHDGENTGLRVHIPDNPPLFAWTEYEYFKHTGDVARIRKVLLEHRYLQRHYEWLNTVKPGILFDYATSLTHTEWIPGKGFKWEVGTAGMDNSPRGDDDSSSIYFLDLSCQQALSALYVAKLAEIIGENGLARSWYAEYEKQKEFVNRRFWSAEDQLYLDRKRDESGFCRVLTPASLWPMLAEIADAAQTDALCAVLNNPEKLGGERPLPSVSRNSPYFAPKGEYWRGGIWMPKVYMTVKGLEKYGKTALADEIARKMIALQYRTWENVEPHTIWECYSPTEDKPATNKVDGWSRPDFCGWSALGPISLFIENVLGFREVNALEKRIVWTPSSAKKSGVKNLMMGGNPYSLIAYPNEGRAEVSASEPFTLCLNGVKFDCKRGNNVIPLPVNRRDR